MYVRNNILKMSHLWFALLLTFSLSICAQPAKQVLKIQNWQTHNGSQVYFVATPEIPMVEMNVIFAAGSGRDGNKPGLAQFTSAMLNQGSRDLTADQIAQQFDSVGALFGASADRDMGTVSLQSLTDPKYLNPAVATFSQVLSAAVFPEDAFIRTKNQTLSAIASEKQSPKALAGNAFYGLVYQNFPYQSPIIGTQQSIETLTAADLKNFYSQYYVAKNAIVTIVGAVNRQQAENLADKITQNLPSGQAAAPLSVVTPQQTTALDKNIKFPAEQTTIIMGQVGINYQSPDYFPLVVGNTILGGSIFSSRLFNEVREKRGLAYGVGSSFRALAAKGPFAIILQTRNNQAQQAVQIARDTLKNFIAAGPTVAEMQRTQSQITNGFPLTLAGNDAISNYLTIIGFYHLPLNYLDTYLQNIHKVSMDQVKTAFQRTIHPDKMVTVQVGNGF